MYEPPSAVKIKQTFSAPITVSYGKVPTYMLVPFEKILLEAKAHPYGGGLFAVSGLVCVSDSL